MIRTFGGGGGVGGFDVHTEAAGEKQGWGGGRRGGRRIALQFARVDEVPVKRGEKVHSAPSYR